MDNNVQLIHFNTHHSPKNDITLIGFFIYGLNVVYLAKAIEGGSEEGHVQIVPMPGTGTE